jgi:hypothetical protein
MGFHARRVPTNLRWGPLEPGFGTTELKNLGKWWDVVGIHFNPLKIEVSPQAMADDTNCLDLTQSLMSVDLPPAAWVVEASPGRPCLVIRI